LKFSGRHLFVNVVAKKVKLRVEALSADDKVLATSKTLTGDTTKRRIEWNDCADVSALSGKPIRFRFHLTNEQLFAFWVTPDPNGRFMGTPPQLGRSTSEPWMPINPLMMARANSTPLVSSRNPLSVPDPESSRRKGQALLRAGKGFALSRGALTEASKTSISVRMRTTLNIDDALLAQAGEYTGETEKTALVRMGLEALVQREAARRLASLAGTMPSLAVPPLRHNEPKRNK
jgi:Arc/MetJ family transcription regulator